MCNKWMYHTIKTWTGLKRENHICSADMVIFIISDDINVNIETVRSMSLLQKQRKARRFIVVSDKDYVKEEIENYYYGEYLYVQWSEEKIDDIVMLYSIQPFTNQIVLNDTNGLFDADPYLADGVNGIKRNEILKLSFLEMDNSQKKEPVQFVESGWIDWDNDKVKRCFSLCGNYRDIVNKLLEDGVISRDKRIVLFALTETMKSVESSLRDYNIEFILDNGSEETTYSGIRIESPNDVLTPYRDDRIILVTSRHYKVICEQLDAFGYIYGKNVFVVHDAYLADKSFSVIMNEISDELQRGKLIYRDLKRQYPLKKYIIHPFSGTGDLYLAYLYFMEKGYCIDDYIYITSFGSCEKLAGILGIKTQKKENIEISQLVAYVRSDKNAKINTVFININYKQEYVDRILGLNGLDFNTILQKTLYKADCRVEPKRLRQIPSKQIFAEYNLKPGRTVLLSPYANSSNIIPSDFWKKIAVFFKTKGYDVCTNISGREKPVTGTKGIEIPYSQILDFVDNAGLFVGARSGLCDILSGTFAEMIIIYPDQQVSKVGYYYGFFSLKNMGLRNDRLTEVVFNNTEQCINEICGTIR